MRGSGTTRAGAERGAAGGRLPALTLALGLLGSVLLVSAELSPIASVEIPGRTCREVADLRAVDRCELSGFERHGGALFLLGAFAALMAVVAGRGRSTPAAAALIAVSLLTLALALLGDLPETNEVGAIGVTYEGATGKAGPGLLLEIAAGLLLACAGGLGLSTRPTASRRAARDHP